MRIKQLIFFIVLLGVSATWMTSCQGCKSKNTNKIELDSIVVKQHIPLITDNDTTLPYADVNVSFIYPVKFRNAEDLARLQQIFIGTFFVNDTLEEESTVEDEAFDSMTPQQAMDKYIADYTNKYKEISDFFYKEKVKLSGETPAWYWYQMSIKNNIMFQNDSLLSYAVEYSDYTGGAHGSYRITYTNINLGSLTTISEEDIFIPDYYKRLTEKIVNKLMEQYNASNPDSLLMQGFFAVDDIVPNNNFWLDDKSIHYTFNQYEIAPYAMGVIDVMVPYSDLTEILIPNGIISRFFEKQNP